MAEATTVVPEEAGLELDRRSARFVSTETEAAYQRWLFDEAMPHRRAGVLLAVGMWVSVGLLFLAVGPPGVTWALASIAFVLAVIAVMYSALRRRAPRATTISFLAGYAVSGLITVGLMRYYLRSDALALTAAVWACFFHLGNSRERPTHAGFAVSTYVLYEAVNLVAAHAEGTLTHGELAFDLFVVVSTPAVALRMLVGADGARRLAYRRTRIIEAQQATIARERARSEGLLKQELSHQVAERSRELGAALVRSDVSAARRQLAPGDRFDARYRIVAELGAGGMGAVYEVERLTDGARLALKVVLGEISGAGAARFAREAEIGARIRHPNLVSIVDVGVASGVPFLVMELVRGGSLEARSAEFADPARARPVLRQIAEGLVALHDAGVVHRDLKPANVLLGGGPGAAVAKISDFGISRFGALDEGSSIDPDAATIGASAPPRSAPLTGTGVVMGTPLYMAPEAARGGRALDASADIFALGIIAYQLFTGRAPFAVPAVMLAMAEQPVPAPAPIDDPRVPATLAALVLECLATDPAQRPRARRMWEALG